MSSLAPSNSAHDQRTDTTQANTSGTRHLPILPGPNPVLGSPQDRFRAMIQEQLGKNTAERPTQPLGPAEGPVLGFNNHQSYGNARLETKSKDSGRTRSGRVRRGNQGTTAGLLSLECQSHRFNPEWISRQAKNGLFQCSVSLNGTIINEGGPFFNTALEAKNDAAHKALAYMRSRPALKSTDDSRGGSSISGRAQTQRAQAAASNQQVPETITNDPAKTATPPACRNAREQGVMKKASFLADLQNYMGISVPKELKEDPNIASAFLEGFALGLRMAQSVPQQPPNNHSSPSETGVSRGRAQDDSRCRRHRDSTDSIDTRPSHYSGHYERDYDRYRATLRSRSPIDHSRRCVGGGVGDHWSPSSRRRPADRSVPLPGTQ